MGSGSQNPEDAPGQVALDAALDLPVGFAFGAAFLDVFECLGAMGHLADCSHVQGAVAPPVDTSVQPVALRVSRQGGDAGSPRPGRRRRPRCGPVPRACDHATRPFAAVTARTPFSSSRDAA